MTHQPRVDREAGAAAPRRSAPDAHPVDVPRSATGSKGDAWVVALPTNEPAPGRGVLAFDTGRDSTTIVVGGVEGAVPRVHRGHDLALVVPDGSGLLRHGPGPEALTDERYVGPCTLVIPAGVWHAIVPDPETPTGVAFFTRPGTAIEPFSAVGPRAEPGLVHLETLPVSPWPALRARVVDTPTGSGPAAADRTGTSGPSAVTASTRPARVVPYAAPGDSYALPLDTGTDTLFVMASRSRSWDRAPVDVAVHRHDREDEYIVLDRADGWLLNGPTQETVMRYPFRAPCVLVMPSGNFHRVVRADDEVGSAILVYAHRSQVAASWDGIVAEMRFADEGA